VAERQQARDVRRRGRAHHHGDLPSVVVDEERGRGPPRVAGRARADATALEADETSRHGPRAVRRPPWLGTCRRALALGRDERVGGRRPRGAHVVEVRLSSGCRVGRLTSTYTTDLARGTG